MIRQSARDSGQDSAPDDRAAVPDAARVYVIDDDGEMRKSLHFLLSTSGITGWPFAGGQDFLDALPSLAPAPILLDIRMLGMDGLELLVHLRGRGVTWPVVVMSGHGDIAIAVRAMKLGAIEFLEKPFEAEALETCIALARETLRRTMAAQAEQVDVRRRLGLLTPREREVVNALSGGAANKQVAYRLGLSTRTVEMYRAGALAKLGVKSVAEVAVMVRDAARPDTLSA